MRISEINQALKGISQVENLAKEDLEIRFLSIDSRQPMSDPRHTLFFAIRTDKNDGAKYIPQLTENGVCAFVRDNSLAALQQLAAYRRSLYEGQVIGITGSNGKTVVKEWLYELLKDDYEITRSPKSYNSQIGVPLSVWQLPEHPATDKPQLAIFEAGISQPGEMEKLEKMIRPTLGVITYIGAEHGENFASLEQKREEKMKLFVHCPKVIEDPTHQNARTCVAVMRALGYDETTIAQRIFSQTHETVMQINLSALVENVRFFRRNLRPETKLVCMVKAFAYGAGSVDVSLALQKAGVADYLAVAVADEGVELRNAGVTMPIIVMDPEVAAIDLILENNLQPNIYSFPILDYFLDAAQKKGLENYPVHIKIDSGMHRLGFYHEQIPELLQRLSPLGPSASQPLRVASIFSHLAVADEPQQDAFTLSQIAYFSECADEIIDAVSTADYKPLKHILNSAGIERFPQYQFTMCRLGIGMYGFSYDGANPKMQNVCTLKTTLLSVKTVRANETIGYGRHTTLSEDRQIAVIPIGYADGFDRRFSNYGGEVLVRGKRCPVVGNVCMDQAMIDVTGTDAQPGDYAIIFGDDLPIAELADRLGTITYEVLTSVSRRVKRVYYY